MTSGRRGRPVPPGEVDFGDFGETEPLSRTFGGDRGKPLDRFYIEGFLMDHAAEIRGRAMEIGENLYLGWLGAGRVTEAEILDTPESGNPVATILADLQTGIGLPSDAYDCIVLTQTLHMIYDVRGTLATLHRALKPGGVVLATVPGITQIDGADGPEKWFWAMTQSAARRLFAERFGEESVTVRQYGNVYAATAFLQGLALEEADPDKLAVVDPLYPVTTGIRAVKR